MNRMGFAVIALASLGALPLTATSYLPVSFGDLVSKADVIFVGEVVDVRPLSIDTRDGPVIKTRVVFQISSPLWGTSGQREILEFLGGELNGVGMAISDMPHFGVGDRRVVFARHERGINPIVGFTQGLLKIQPDAAGIDRVLTLDGVPLVAPESIGTRLRPEAMRATPMRLADFRDRVSAALRAAGRR